MVQLLSQVVYETNADVTASFEAMVKNPLVVADQTDKGLLWFKFKENRTVFLLSPLGKLQAKWNDIAEKKTLFRLVRSLLVPRPNEKLVVTPVKQQTWIEYPVPDSFRLYWCDKASEYVLKASPEAKETQKPDDLANKSRDSEGSGQPRIGIKSSGFKDDDVRTTLEELRHELIFREPTFKELAVRIDLAPVMLEIFLKKAGWERQSQETAMILAENAINLAGWIQLKERGKPDPELVALSLRAIDAASVDDIVRAKALIKKYPAMVPEAAGRSFRWPNETIVKWKQVFGKDPPEPASFGDLFVFPDEANDY